MLIGWGEVGQVKHYFRIIQITANMLSSDKYPSLEGRYDFGSQASQLEPSLGNKAGHQTLSNTIFGYKLGMAIK